METIHWARVDTVCVLTGNTVLSNYKGHGSHLINSIWSHSAVRSFSCLSINCFNTGKDSLTMIFTERIRDKQLISEIRSVEHGTSLFVLFNDGDERHIPAKALREAAMDATSRREKLLTGQVTADDTVRITALNPMGSTGINIQFSDGHLRAIYPYAYIEKLLTTSDN